MTRSNQETHQRTQPVSPYEIVLGNTAREGSPVLADSNTVGMYVLDGRLFLRADDAEQLGALPDRFFMEIGEDADGQAVPFHPEEGYMKEYDSNYALVCVDGAQLKTEKAYAGFDYGITGHCRGYEAYPESRLETQNRPASELGVIVYRFNYNPTTKDDFAYMDVPELCEVYGMELMLVLDDFSGTVEYIGDK